VCVCGPFGIVNAFTTCLPIFWCTLLSDLPFEGSSEYQPDIGRVPMAAAEPVRVFL
jgi:hypothetical protein